MDIVCHVPVVCFAMCLCWILRDSDGERESHVRGGEQRGGGEQHLHRGPREEHRRAGGRGDGQYALCRCVCELCCAVLCCACVPASFMLGLTWRQPAPPSRSSRTCTSRAKKSVRDMRPDAQHTHTHTSYNRRALPMAYTLRARRLCECGARGPGARSGRRQRRREGARGGEGRRGG